MNNCSGAPAQENAEAYLLGTLSETDAERFEEHYFDCSVCLAQVEALQAVKAALQKEPLRLPARVTPWPYRAVWLGAIAAALILAFVVLHTHRQAPAVARGLAPAGAPASESASGPAASVASLTASRLADLTMPAFHVPNLRGQREDRAFEDGMKAYAIQDCANAMTSLVRVPASSKDARAAHFYNGVCQMHLGNLAAAAGTLRAVAAAGDSPEQEAAYYYTAQIALAGNDVSTARQNLAQTISLHGDFERRAQAELAKLGTPDGDR